jgi:hypothetical protein
MCEREAPVEGLTVVRIEVLEFRSSVALDYVE